MAAGMGGDALNSPAPLPRGPRRAVVFGAAGFIGSHLCRHLLRAGAAVIAVDNLCREGAEARWAALAAHSEPPRQLRADVRDFAAVRAAVEGQTEIYHLAAQVAVTRSIESPRGDFEVNAGGTVNVLEAARRCGDRPFVLVTSTNKVYGEMAGRPPQPTGEAQPLDFHSPYGCSKGAADQYTRDYARTFGLPAVVFRMSCIYGPGQAGSEDQGWVAHFAAAALAGRPITLYGDGEQQRDLLYIDDLIAAMHLAWSHRQAAAGQAFNIGGGAANLRSLRQVAAALERRYGRPIELRQGPRRQGDQQFYCSDYRRFAALTGWRPRVPADAGLERLCAWLEAQEREARLIGRRKAA